jgi:starch synthase
MPRILMVTSEASPYVKTGGLGDVLGALPAALVDRGEEVAVVLPRYRAAEIPAADRIWDAMPLWVGFHYFTAAIDLIVSKGVRYYFVDCPPLYDRTGVYGDHGVDYPDNHMRFGLLNQAALGIARYIFKTDIFHCHDWQAGLLAPYLRALAGDPTFFGVTTVLTIHNLGYQGIFPAAALGDLGLDRSLFHPGGLEFYGNVSFLKAGIVWSDAITTVSPTYAKEIQTPEYGAGLDGVLRSRADKVTGILNGVDYREWDPRNDPDIAAAYSSDDLAGKATCKRALLQEMFPNLIQEKVRETGLPGDLKSADSASVDARLVDSSSNRNDDLANAEKRPLIGIVSRFAGQKGFDLFIEIAADVMEEDVAFAVLGSGEAALENAFLGFAQQWPDRFGVRIGYDNALAHRIEAGADMFLMPSRYEPSGLNQMYSLRYGTVPIVRATGGLEDTIDGSISGGTGLKFEGTTPEALLETIRSALKAWRNRDAWVARMRRGMAKDFSWGASAAKYRELYRGVLVAH